MVGIDPFRSVAGDEAAKVFTALAMVCDSSDTPIVFAHALLAVFQKLFASTMERGVFQR
jgi:hypothetical protein